MSARRVVITGWLFNPFGGKLIKLTRGPRYRSKPVQLPHKFNGLVERHVRIIIEEIR